MTTAGAGPKHPAIIPLIVLSGNRAEFENSYHFILFQPEKTEKPEKGNVLCNGDCGSFR
jgi:hypothetical protein